MHASGSRMWQRPIRQSDIVIQGAGYNPPPVLRHVCTTRASWMRVRNCERRLHVDSAAGTHRTVGIRWADPGPGVIWVGRAFELTVWLE